MLDAKDQPGNISVSYIAEKQLNQRPNQEPLRVLSEEDWAFWRHNGYVIIKNAVPAENVQPMIDLIWEFEEKDPHDPDTWYQAPLREIKMKELVGSGMVEMYNMPQMWANRQHPRVYNSFVDIWGLEELWVTIDRANLNLPIRPGHEFKGFIHWDIDTSLAQPPVNVQGVLSLTATNAETGGFQCVPQLYREFDEWVKKQPKDRNPFQPDISGFTLEQVNTEPGDLLIWDSMLAHGIRPNRSARPRLAQYISMTPAQEDKKELRQWRVKSWQERIAPEGYPFPGDPRGWEQKQPGAANLTELGEKLLGLKDW